MGLPPKNIITWPQNGIEYYYPPTLLDSIFGLGGAITIQGDRITRNGLNYSKNELVERIVSLLTPDTQPHPEFESLFLSKLAARAA
jgi:hypothetical protein